MTAHRTFGQWLVMITFVGAAGCGGASSTLNTSTQQDLIPSQQAGGSLASTSGSSALPPCGASVTGSCDATAAHGWMTGGGSVLSSAGQRVTHGFEMHCDASDPRQNLEVNWDGGHRFSLTTLKLSRCLDESSMSEGHPNAGFNLFEGTATGQYDGQDGATIQFSFTDAGEPGTNDTAALTVFDAAGHQVLSVKGTLTGGNQQAHPATDT